jgi:leucyl aminopeptidase
MLVPFPARIAPIVPAPKEACMARIKVIPRVPGGALDTVAVPIKAETKRLPSELADLDKKAGGTLSQAIASGDVSGGAGALSLVHGGPRAKCKRILVVGVGKKPSPASIRKAAAAAAKRADRLGVKKLVMAGFTDLLGAKKQRSAAQNTADGAGTGPWLDLRFRERRAADGKAGALKTVEIVGAGKDAKAGAADGAAIADAMNWSKDIMHAPSNFATPVALANEAKKLARGRRKVTTTILNEAQMKKLGMGSLLSVGEGSEKPSRLVVVEYKGGKGKPIALVGKGVMFDSGGISLKPGGGMDRMKYDMCGGGGVLGAIRAAADMNLKLNIVAVVGAVENMPDGKATNPGDIVTASNGVTIEILNTDAEGRLVLADALAYTIKKYKPTKIVDMATLTGAVVIALGRHCVGAVANNDKMCADIIKAGEAIGERAWQLPLWPEHIADARSTIADIKNIGPPRQAGTIMGAALLSYFVDDTPWVHLDIAATAWEDGAGRGPQGAGIRLLAEWLQREAGR